MPSDRHVEALASVFEVSPQAVRSVVVKQFSDFALLHGAIAVTRANAIYLRGSAEQFFATPRLALHEYYHVLRQWNTGDLTVRRYLGEWIRHGCCYDKIKYEVDANRFADRNVQRLLRRWLRQSKQAAGKTVIPRRSRGEGSRTLSDYPT